jgi:hypothetical protein
VLQGAVSWIAVGWSVGRLVSRTERRAKAGRVPAMFAQGGVDERQQGVQFVAESPGLLLQEFLPYAVLVYCTPMMGRARPPDRATRPATAIPESLCNLAPFHLFASA